MNPMKHTETTPTSLVRMIQLKMREWGYELNMAENDPAAAEVTVPQPDGSHQTFIVSVRRSEAV